MLFSLAVAGGLAIATILLHLEALRQMSRLWPRLDVRPRLRFALLAGGVMLAHIAEIWLFAIVFFLTGRFDDASSLGGEATGRFLDYLYFSGASYTSLGFGDVYPIGHLRLLSTAETLIGLLMIAWSASYTFVYMQRHWGSGDGSAAID